MAVIELGLVNPDADAPPPEPGRPPLRRPEPRRVLAAAVAVGCLLAVTGSARPDPRGLPQLWTTPFGQQTDTFRLTGDSVYVLSHGGGQRLTAHDARTGAVRWSSTAVQETTWLSVVEAGVLLMPTGAVTVAQQEPDGTESTREFNRDTLAVDTATGRQLWRRTGEVTAARGDRVLLAEWNATGDRARRLRMVRLSDGGTDWSRARGELDLWTTDTTVGARAERLVTVDPHGSVEVLDLADGSVVATGRLPWPAPARDDDYSTVSVQGRRIYLDQTVRNTSSVSVYDTENLRLIWRVELGSPGGSYPCGPMVCLSDAAGTAAHDRETGELRWRLPGTASGTPLPAGVLLVEENGEGRRSLVDGTTGRLLADLGTATPVWDTLGRGTPYLVARTVEPPGRTSVSRFDPAAGEVLLRGTIVPVLDYGCQQQDRLLACVTPDDRLVVTDVG